MDSDRIPVCWSLLQFERYEYHVCVAPPLTQNSTHFISYDQNIWTSVFSCAAPSVWNSLLHEIRHIQSTIAFKLL